MEKVMFEDNKRDQMFRRTIFRLKIRRKDLMKRQQRIHLASSP